MQTECILNIAVAGTGISGVSAAWLLSRRHRVTVYEQAERIGGHSNTIVASLGGVSIPVDTGFIVFNPAAYPNLVALFELLGVPTQDSDMSFAVSLDRGALEYSGSGLPGLFGQPLNLLRPRFWSMLRDTLRFYREAARDDRLLNDEQISLGEYLRERGYSAAFRDDHLLPMASAIWSASASDILSYPAAFADRIRLDTAIRTVERFDGGVAITDSKGRRERYDHIVMATHADQALAALADSSERERELLGAFRYSRNLAVLHSDESFMPRRRGVWSSWNYLGERDATGGDVCVTYWMNRLQNLSSERPLFVTLNPQRPPRAGALLHSEVYEHPVFDAAALQAQQKLWMLQGERNTWYCGAHFGSGFHEDGLQAGLAVAEQLGGLRRPWSVPNESGRIVLAVREPDPSGASVPT